METTSIIAVAIISIIGNIIQFFLNKKTNDLKNLKDRVELLDTLQDKQTKSYEKEMEYQNDKIKVLKDKLEIQDKKLKQNELEISRLSILVNKLIGNGCHLENCPNRSPYTVDEINEMTKNKKNEKINSRPKK